MSVGEACSGELFAAAKQTMTDGRGGGGENLVILLGCAVRVLIMME